MTRQSSCRCGTRSRASNPARIRTYWRTDRTPSGLLIAEIMGIDAPPGERAFGYLDITALATGKRLEVPMHVLAGARPGPTLLVASTAHGDEIFPMLTIRELLSRVDPKSLRGTLVAVPLLNPPAFETQT